MVELQRVGSLNAYPASNNNMIKSRNKNQQEARTHQLYQSKSELLITPHKRWSPKKLHSPYKDGSKLSAKASNKIQKSRNDQPLVLPDINQKMAMNDTKFNWHNQVIGDSQGSPYNYNNQQLRTPIFGRVRGSGSMNKPPKYLQNIKPRGSDFGGMTL